MELYFCTTKQEALEWEGVTYTALHLRYGYQLGGGFRSWSSPTSTRCILGRGMPTSRRLLQHIARQHPRIRFCPEFLHHYRTWNDSTPDSHTGSHYDSSILPTTQKGEVANIPGQERPAV